MGAIPFLILVMGLKLISLEHKKENPADQLPA
jgi:hypothetical protein